MGDKQLEKENVAKNVIVRSKGYISYDIILPHKCCICGKSIKSISGLGSHIKNQHKETSYKKYILEHFGIDTEELYRIWESNTETRAKRRTDATSSANRGKSPKERMTPKQYSKWRESMSKVFTITWFKDKYGEEMGEVKYKERALKVGKNSHFKKYNRTNSNNWSKISQELFWEVHKIINNSTTYFAELNHEFGCETDTNFDFVVRESKKVIEFNGDIWHANPQTIKSNYRQPYSGLTAQEVYRKDERKLDKAKKKGYIIFIVWESEYRKDKCKVLQDCINFLRA